MTVRPVNGAYVQIPVTCTSPEVLDLFIELEQEHRVDGTSVRIQGTTARYYILYDSTTHTCTATVLLYFGKFQSGRATVRARVGGPAALGRA